MNERPARIAVEPIFSNAEIASLVQEDFLAFAPDRPAEMEAVAAYVLTGRGPEALQILRQAPEEVKKSFRRREITPPDLTPLVRRRRRFLLLIPGRDPGLTGRYLQALHAAFPPQPVPPASEAQRLLNLLVEQLARLPWPSREPPPVAPPGEALSLAVLGEALRPFAGDWDPLAALSQSAETWMTISEFDSSCVAVNHRLAAEGLDFRKLTLERGAEVMQEALNRSGAHIYAPLVSTLQKSSGAMGFLFAHIATTPDAESWARGRYWSWIHEASAETRMQVLLGALEAPDDRIRRQAVSLLTRLRGPAVGAALAARLSREPSADIRRLIEEDAALRAFEIAPDRPDDAESYAALGGERIAIPPLRPFLSGERPVFGEADKAELLALVAAANEKEKAWAADYNARASKTRESVLIDQRHVDPLIAHLNGASEAPEPLSYSDPFSRLMREGLGVDWLERRLLSLPQRESLLITPRNLSRPPPARVQKASYERRGNPWDAPLVAYARAPNADLRQTEALATQHGFAQPGQHLAALIGSSEEDYRAEDYAPEAVWPLIATHLSVIEEAFSAAAHQGRLSKRNAVRILTLLPAAPQRFLRRLLEIAVAPHKTPEREDARALLAKAPGIDAHLARLLQDPRQEIRLTAAEWMARRRRPEAEAPLRAAFRTEKAQAVRAALFDALARLGADLSEWVGPQALTKQAEAAARRPFAAPPEALAAALEGLGQLRWRGGPPLPDLVLRWWIHLALRLNKPGGDEMFALHLDQLEPQDAERLGSAVLGLWPFPERGLLALALKGPAAQAAEVARRHLKEQAKWDPMGCMSLLNHLGGRADAEALQILLAVSETQKQKAVRKLAGTLVARIAEDRGWTPEQLAERLVPDAGLDAEGRLELSFGEGAPYLARLDEKLDLALFNPKGARIKTPPAGEEPAAVEARKLYAATRKRAKQAVQDQGARLRGAMLVERRWSLQDWREIFPAHPLLRKMAERLVWLGLDAEGATLGGFRPTPEGEILGPDEAPVDLARFAAVKLAHELLVAPETGALWRAHLKDYEIAPLFPQFGCPVFRAPAEGAEAISDRDGWVTDTGILRSMAKKLGYVRGEVGDSGGYFDYVRPLPGSGLLAVFEFSGDGVGADRSFPATVERLIFARDQNGRPGATLPLEKIPPALLSEVWGEYRAFAAKGVFDPQKTEGRGR